MRCFRPATLSRLLALGLAGSCWPAGAAAATCYPEGAIARLSGTVAMRVNDNPRGHMPYPYSVLELDSPICVAARDAKAEDVRIVTILPARAGEMAEPADFIGRRKTVAGKLMLNHHGEAEPASLAALPLFGSRH